MKKLVIILAVLLCSFALFADTLDSKTIVDQFSYIVGADIFSQYSSYYGINAKNFAQGALDVENGKFSMTNAEMNDIINAFNTYMTEKNEKLKKENLTYAETFLSTNKKKAGVTTTSSGLQYTVTKKGKGATAKSNSTVTVYYTLYAPDGSILDKADKTTGPATFSLTGVVPGFAEACMVAPAGSQVTAWLHPSLGYGENGGGSVEPNMLLKFEIEIVSIK